MRVHVNTHHPASIRSQELNRYEAYQPEAYDDKGLPQGGLSKSQAFKPYGPQHGERRVIIGHRLGYFDAQVHGHIDQFGVLPVGRDPVSGPQVIYSLANVEHHARVAVAEGNPLFQLPCHSLIGLKDALCFQALQHCAYLVRVLSGLLKKASFAEFEDSAFSAWGDEALACSNQDMAVFYLGAWNIHEFCVASLLILKYLFHVASGKGPWSG
jgi:hypothetical protein